MSNFTNDLPAVCFIPVEKKAIFYYDDLTKFKLTPLPLLSLQVIVLSLFPRFLHFFLKPLGQPLFVSQLLVGILLGPSVIGQNEGIKRFLFPKRGEITFDTLAVFSSMFFLFKVGVKMDPTIIKKSGKKSYAIGFSCFASSFMCGYSTMKYFTNTLDWGYTGLKDFNGKRVTDLDEFNREVQALVVISSLSSFPVIACALSDLNILNSDLGRLAASSAMVTDIFHLSLRIFSLLKLAGGNGNAPKAFVAVLAFIMFVAFVVRPMASWMVKRTPEGGAVKEIYIFIIFATILLCAYASEAIGLDAITGTFFLGLAIPDGPPLGASLEDKLEYLVSIVLMPVNVASVGTKTDYHKLSPHDEHNRSLVFAKVCILISCYVGKLFGVSFTSIYLGVPVRNALVLGLILNIKGIVEVAIINNWVNSHFIDIRANTIVIFTMLLMSAIAIPLVRYLYDPSTRYSSYRRRFIVQPGQNQPSNFRILVCVHNEDDVKPIISVLEASNPTRYLPLSIIVLHLIELVGRASPLLIAHPPHIKSSSKQTKTERIINAFQRFGQRHHTNVSIESFSTIAPYASMDNDICEMSVDKGTSLIIFPFHRQGSRDDRKRPLSNRSMKTLIQNLITNAPCSLGLLIDCTDNVSLTGTISSDTPYRVAVLFLGGPDDREALAYAMNMIHHRYVCITVIRFFADSDIQCGNRINYSERQKLLDDELVDHFRVKMMDNERGEYKEAEVKDGVETVWVIRSIKDNFDLIMVGRQRQHSDPKLVAGLGEDWSECEELGIIGDLLASSDFDCKGSILVVQQRQEELSQNQLS